MTDPNKQSKRVKESPYEDIEKLVTASKKPVDSPSADFKQGLLKELKSGRQGSAAPEQSPEHRPAKKSWFSFPTLAPVGVGLLGIFVVSVSLFVYQQMRIRTVELGQEPEPLIIDQKLGAAELEGAFELTATDVQDAGIAPGSSFELLAKVDTSVEQIKESLSFTPQVAYAVEKTGENVYTITPEQPLEPGTLVNAKLAVAVEDAQGTVNRRSFSWSYEVQEEFQVVSTLPADTAIHVPFDTGIEIEFSHPGFESYDGTVTVSPEVAGRIEVHYKTLVFVPDADLQPETVYTVTVQPGITLPSTGETLAEPYIFQFETNHKPYGEDGGSEGGAGVYSVESLSVESSSQEKPAFLVQASDSDEEVAVPVSIYQFGSQETYEAALDSYLSRPAWTVYDRGKWNYDTSSLTLHSTTDLPIQDLGSSWQYYMELPEALPAGFYLIEVAARDGSKIHIPMNIADISAYVTVSESELLVWSHNPLTSQPLEGAEVSLPDGTVLGATGNEGLLRVDTPASLLEVDTLTQEHIVIAGAGSTLIIPLSQQSNSWDGFEADARTLPYWSYLYTDQPFYKPNGTMHYFGVASPRDGIAVDEVTVQLSQGWEGVSMQEYAVEPGKFGTFDGAISLDNFSPGYYSLQLLADGILLYEYDFEVLTYVKPAYEITLDPPQVGVIEGEDLSIDITAQFFDGTPVANTAFREEFTDMELTTDAAGHATLNYAFTYEGQSYSWRGDSEAHWLEVVPVSGEEARITGTGRVRTFRSSQLIDLDSQVDGTTASISGTLYTLDLDALNSGAIDFWARPTGDVVAGQELTVETKRIWYTKEKTGTHYDYIMKKTVPQYTYERHEETLPNQTVTTGPQGTFAFDLEMDKTSSYEIKVKATDSEGRTTFQTSYVSAGLYEWGWEGNYLHMEFTETEEQSSQWAPSSRQFSLGDQVAVDYLIDNGPLPSGEENSYLFLQERAGIRDAAVEDDSHYEFTFDEDDIPNVVIQGVWYDGRSYWMTDASFGWFSTGLVASYKEADRELAVDVSTDKESYGPGDEVTLDIQVNRPDGSARETVVNINLVDEAIYALFESNFSLGWYGGVVADFNRDLYKDQQAGVYAAYASHRYPFFMAGVEGGGGGDSRSDFPDQALFETVTTDNSGHAQVTFTLPDSLTSWRMTTHAVDDEFYAASVVDSLVVTQPFFTTAVISESYLEGDQPMIRVRSFGDELQQSDTVQYQLSCETLALEQTTVEAAGSNAVEVPLGALPVGTHELTVEASVDGLSDSITRPITVLPSYVAIPVAETYPAEAGWKPTVDAERTIEVTFTDEHVGQFFRRVQRHLYTYGDRLDQRAGRQLAAQLLNEYYGRSVAADPLDTSQYQAVEGGLTLFPYSDQDLLLSAHIAASGLQDQVNSAALAGYFDSVLFDETQTTLRHAFALYGLASLGEPVLYEVQQMLDSDQITDVDRLYLALALAELGSYDEATVILDALLTAHGEEADEMLMMNLGDNRDLQIENTVVAAMVAAVVQDDRADALFNYATHNWTKDVLLILQELNYLDARMAVLPQTPTTITYSYMNRQETVELSHGMTHTVLLTPSTLQDFSVDNVVGEATAVVHYTRAATAEELNFSDKVSVARSYPEGPFADGQLVRIQMDVTIAGDAPDGTYEVTDFLPSGMRVVTNVYNPSGWYGEDDMYRHPYHIDGQRVSFRAWKGNSSFSYYARVVGPGTFTAEAPVVQSMGSPSIRSAGTSQQLTIE